MIQPDWYFIDARWVNLIQTNEGLFLGGKRLGLIEKYIFILKNWKILHYGKNGVSGLSWREIFRKLFN